MVIGTNEMIEIKMSGKESEKMREREKCYRESLGQRILCW